MITNDDFDNLNDENSTSEEFDSDDLPMLIKVWAIHTYQSSNHTDQKLCG